ncbi:uncharacterized protein LOC130701097 [Daphnia carinata]|uniref:uncharacterized protein LOC130701097 n=1 Tax=Daphnia carinata TaxID=120202 RepID=UPI002579CD2E|nr:uncharacterized protein LOC130701097 [Daphnia carinata]
MGIRPTVGSGQSAMATATLRYIIFLSVMMGVTGGQQLPTPRNHDNLNAAEIRFDPRALSWMEFTKPEPSSSHALQQKHQQWLQPPMPVNSNSPRRTPEQQWNPHGQHWPGHFDHSQQHHPLLTNHPDRSAAHQQPYRSVQLADEMQRRPKQQQVPPIPARDVPSGSISSEQWHRELAQPPREPTYHPGGASASSTETSDILSDVRSDEILEEEFYDSSELFEEDETELDSTGGEHSAKSKAEEEMLTRQKDEEDATMEILSAFTSGLSNLPRRNEESGSDKEQVSAKTPAASIQQTPTWKQLYPQLLGPATPPGKRVIVTEEHPSSKPKAIDNHRVSYGLTAASVYARIQPSLRPRNGTGGLRQRVVPRPYKRRPITVKSTTTVPVDKQQEPHAQDVEEGDEEEDEFDLITEEIETENEPAITEIEEEELKEMANETQQENEPKIEAQSEPDKLSSKESIQVNIAANETEAIGEEEEPINEKSQPVIQLKNPTSTMENETLKSKPSSPAAASGPADIKSLLRSAGPLSLSEILQQKGMSLADLLKGGTQIAPVIGVTTSSPIASNAASPKNQVKVEHDTTSTATPITSTHTTTATPMVTDAPIRPGVMPSVKPISFRELLAAKNVTLQEIIHPDMTVIGTEKPIAAVGVGGTLKPGVKLPIPFAPGRGKGLAGLVASTAAPSEEQPAESMNSKSTTTPQPSKPMNSKSVSELKPLIFGGGRPLDEDSDATTTTSTTTIRTTSRQMVIHSKRPYVAGMNVGEYGSHLGRSFEEEGDSDEDGSNTRSKSSNNLVGSYGMQRPIATSRLTPAPPRKQRPVLNFNYNALSEEEDEDETGTTTTSSPILTHFNEDELIENDPYFDLPVSVRNAIIVSSTIGGFCLVVFLGILLVFRIRQKTRIRLRHPAALLGLGGMTDMTASNGSDSSGITTPTSHAASKSGYAKLPRRSSSLWGTLRRSVRQMEVHYS